MKLLLNKLIVVWNESFVDFFGILFLKTMMMMFLVGIVVFPSLQSSTHLSD